ncbi:MAG: hypothetical protein WC729_12360 [Sphingomonas sp.]|uniref:hypothetical protein n=1 Tax=Sphingomonas sp. TaxID=28214 RepID=UPI00356A5454
MTEDRARWVRRGESLGWYALLIGSAGQAAAGAASDGRGAAFGAVFAGLAAIVAACRRGWAWPLALYWLTSLALSLPFDGAAIARPTAWVAPAEAALLALAAAAGGAVIGLRRVLPITAAMLLLLFGGIHLSQGPAIAALTPAWLPMRSVAPYASGLAQIAAGLWLAVRPSRGPAWTMAAMYLSWLPLIHLPRLLAEPGDASEWRFAAMALALAGALILSTKRSDREEIVR